MAEELHEACRHGTGERAEEEGRAPGEGAGGGGRSGIGGGSRKRRRDGRRGREQTEEEERAASGGAEQEAEGANAIRSIKVGWISPADFGGPPRPGSGKNIPI